MSPVRYELGFYIPDDYILQPQTLRMYSDERNLNNWCL
jgi:hypothetical protein